MKKILVLLLVMVGCTVNEGGNSSSDKLTVEGQIEEGKYAEVYLTNSLLFDGVIDSLEVAKSIESKAKVVLSDGENSEILTLKRENSRFPFLYYRSNIIKGEFGKEYSLSVFVRGKEFVSNTAIPEKTEVLSVEFFEWINEGVVEPDYRNIRLIINNAERDRCRYFKILIKNEKEEKFEMARPFIFNTENIFSETFPVIVSYIKFDDDGKKKNQIKVGEVIEFKLVAITKDQFNFWKSVVGDDTSFLNGTSFTNQVITNISNGAFGYWSGENAESFKFKVE